MKVLFLATLPPLSSTIIGRIIPLALELKKRGHESSIVSLGEENFSVTSDFPVKIAGPSVRLENHKPNFIEMLSRIIRGTNGLKKAVKKGGFDIAVLVKPHMQNVLAAKKIKVPIILDSDDDERYSSRLSLPQKMIMEKMEKMAVKKAAAITACSPYLVNRYKLMAPGKKIYFVPTGISKEKGKRQVNLRNMFEIRPDEKIILYIGSVALSSGHRLDHILNIWDQLAEEMPAVRFVIAGDGIDLEKIKTECAKKKYAKRIHFFGRFSSDASDSLAEQADLLVDPADRGLASEAKSSSRAVLAIKNGTPIVAANAGIRRVIIPHKLHYWALYEPDDLKTLLRGIRTGLKENAKADFRDASKDSLNKWTWEQIGAKFCDLVEELS